MAELFTIFLNVMAPVFSIVLLGYLAGPRLQLDARSLSRYSYFVLTPAFVFNVLVHTQIEAKLVVQMTLYMVAVEIGCALAGLVAARLLRRSAQMTAIYVSIAVFGNVGNFGFPIVQFALGREALGATTIYFLVILVVSFVIGVAAANWERGGGIGATLAVIKTPGLLVVPPAIFFNWAQLALPPVVARPLDLLANALIPTMLFALGVQFASAGIPRLDLDMVATSVVRLLVSPLIALLCAMLFGVAGLERSVGILQASMPTAVLVSMIASEYDMRPTFVTATVLFSTLVSIITLTAIITLVL